MTCLKVALILCIVLIAILFVFSTLYFFSGSLESFPMGEQDNKIKTVFGLIAVTCLVLETALFWVYRRLTTNT